MRRKAVYQTPDPRFKEQPNICRKSPTQGSKAEPATCQNPRPDANRYFRIRRNFLPGVNQRGGACGARPLPCPPPPAVEGGRELGPARCAASPRAPGDGAELPITFNVLLTFRATGAKFRGSFHLVMPGLSRPSRSSDDVPCPYPPPLAGEGRGARDKPGDDARELFTSTR